MVLVALGGLSFLTLFTFSSFNLAKKSDEEMYENYYKNQ